MNGQRARPLCLLSLFLAVVCLAAAEPGGEGLTSGNHQLWLMCDDVEATYRQLRQRGVEFIQEPQKQPWGTFAKFKDPDGNQFVLSSA